ncbi:hypothetical protein ACTSKR_07675 [Chitinibacteraceae bacterium HSL-7]
MGVNVRLDGHKRIDFDKKEVRKTMRRAGADVRKAARALIARKVRSGAGENPGRKTGRLYRSLGYKVSRSGFLVAVRHEKVAGMEAPYWVYLYYGVRAGAVRRRGHKKQAEGAWRISPRNNYIADALESRRGAVQTMIADTLKRALRPGG